MMLQKYKGYMLLTGLAVLLLLLSACGTLTLANSNLPPPAQTLQNSAKAMSRLKSAHFDLQAMLNLQSASSTSRGAGGVSFNITGHGDAAAPDQAATNVFLGQDSLLSVISTGGKIYTQRKDGTWYVIDKSKITDSVQKIFSQNPALNLGTLTNEIKNARLTDHGQEVLNGVALDHITATLDAQTLQTLSSQLNGLLPGEQQSNQNALNQATLDLWIDQSTWYVHQAELNITAHLDLSKVPALNFNGQNINLPAGVLPVTLKAQLNFSKFDQPVNIQAPPNARPLPQQ